MRDGIAAGKSRSDFSIRRSATALQGGYFFFEVRFLGTFAPLFRASDSPIAIACFLLVTFFPDRPLFSVPRLRSCIAFSTFADAFLPYLAIADVLLQFV